MMRGFVTTFAAVALVLAGCASGTDEGAGGSGTSESPAASATSSSPVAMGNGAFFVLPYQGSGAQRYAIGADGTIGPGSPVPWESGPDAGATLLKDALGPWALTSTVELPLTDVSRTTQLQVRNVETGEVLHQIDVPGWCSGADGASYPCLLLDENRMVRSTPIDGEGSGTITVSSTTTGETLAEYGPFPGLAGVNPTNSPDTLVVVTYDQAGKQHRYQTLDTRTGETSRDRHHSNDPAVDLHPRGRFRSHVLELAAGDRPGPDCACRGTRARCAWTRLPGLLGGWLVPLRANGLHG